MLKRALSWCSGALVAAMIIIVPSSAAHAGPPALPGNWTYVGNPASGRYLSLLGGSGDNGTHAAVWTFNGNLDQQWEMVPVRGESGYFHLRNATSWRQLGIAGASTANGAHAVLWTGNTSADQKWRTAPNAATNTYRLINQGSGKCLGTSGGSTAQGAHLVQWTCNGHPDQNWTLG